MDTFLEWVKTQPIIEQMGVFSTTSLTTVFVLLGLICYGETAVVLRYLKRLNIMDTPGSRSNHKAPTPRGGGIAVMDNILFSFLLLSLFVTGEFHELGWIVLIMLMLGLISFYDDVRGASVKLRLGVQVLAVAAGTYVLHLQGSALVFQGLLPLPLDRILAALCWLWFINLYNFMDGIDGITGVETFSIAMGVALVSALAGLAPPLIWYAMAVAAAICGFMPWNWHPAKIFLGDIGSVCLGFVLGFLLLRLALEGHLIPALILPAYYLGDSGVTLIRRALKKEKIWQAHSSHFYQQAVRGGFSHSQVSKRIALCNSVLVALAMLAVYRPHTQSFFLMVSVVVVAGFLWYLAPRAKK